MLQKLGLELKHLKVHQINFMTEIFETNYTFASCRTNIDLNNTKLSQILRSLRRLRTAVSLMLCFTQTEESEVDLDLMLNLFLIKPEDNKQNGLCGHLHFYNTVK